MLEDGKGLVLCWVFQVVLAGMLMRRCRKLLLLLLMLLLMRFLSVFQTTLSFLGDLLDWEI